jgi:hypothetical protein
MRRRVESVQWNTLLIYETIPDVVAMYAIPSADLSEDQIQWLTEANGRKINLDDINDGMEYLVGALVESPEHADGGWSIKFPGHCPCELVKYRVFTVGPDAAPLVGYHIDRVFWSGFLM